VWQNSTMSSAVEAAPSARAAPHAQDSDAQRRAAPARPSSRAVAAWLFACCALVFAMVVVGGVTRLTHSGLSITEWAPIVGTLPPLSDAAWQAAFAKYQATPEFRQAQVGQAALGEQCPRLLHDPFAWVLEPAVPSGLVVGHLLTLATA